MLAIAELLTKALETLFRRKTVNVAAFANSDGPVSDIPLGYFSSDRIKKHPEKPINRIATERFVIMARAALSGDSYYDVLNVSSRAPHPREKLRRCDARLRDRGGQCRRIRVHSGSPGRVPATRHGSGRRQGGR